MKLEKVVHGRTMRTLVSLALTTVGAVSIAGQAPPAHTGATYPFPGGTNVDGSLKPAPPLTRLFAEEYYTEYSLLDPSTGAYRITRRTEESPIGSKEFDWIRFEGDLVPLFSPSEAGDLEFYDPRSGKPLKYIFGKPGDGYSIRVALPRAVPQGGVGRIYIYKTFRDPRTYIVNGDEITWVRSLIGSRIGVVLPKGFGLVSTSVAAQIITQEDGRLRLSFANPSGQVDPVTIRARRLGANFKPVPAQDSFLDDLRTLYDLGAPESHTVALDQRYTEYRKGERAMLDTLSGLPLESLKVVDLDTATEFAPYKSGPATLVKLAVPIVDDKQSVHFRITGSLKDPGYKRDGPDLVFDRTLVGLRNTVLLPKGWEIASVSQAGTIGMYQGRAFVAFVNLGAESRYHVTIRAAKRTAN